MAQNKGANVRYRAIDKCLSAKHGRYSWEDLQRACEDALYRAFSERISVSRRQIFNDLNFMESEAGFRALIKRTKDGKRTYYTYEDPNFSIANMPLSYEELDQLKETILLLNRFKGLPQFEWMEELQSKLADKLHLNGTQESVIGFEQNMDLKGLENITPLFDAIVNKQVLSVISPSRRTNRLRARYTRITSSSTTTDGSCSVGIRSSTLLPILPLTALKLYRLCWVSTSRNRKDWISMSISKTSSVSPSPRINVSSISLCASRPTAILI